MIQPGRPPRSSVSRCTACGWPKMDCSRLRSHQRPLSDLRKDGTSSRKPSSRRTRASTALSRVGVFTRSQQSLIYMVDGVANDCACRSSDQRSGRSRRTSRSVRRSFHVVHNVAGRANAHDRGQHRPASTEVPPPRLAPLFELLAVRWRGGHPAAAPVIPGNQARGDGLTVCQRLRDPDAASRRVRSSDVEQPAAPPVVRSAGEASP
jgi:hypothetical protein